MNNNLTSTFGCLQNRLSGHYAMMVYLYSQLCTKADPMVLLQVVVKDGVVEHNIEDVAFVKVHDQEGDDDKFDVYPKSGPDGLPSISQGIMDAYPEFKQSLEPVEIPPDEESGESVENEDGGETGVEENGFEDGNKVFLRLTIPPVDDDRKKAMDDAVNIIHDTTKGKMDVELGAATAEMSVYTVTSSPEEAEKAKKRFEEIKKQFEDLREEETEKKKKEIEEANKRYHQQEEERQCEKDAEDDTWTKLKVE